MSFLAPLLPLIGMGGQTAAGLAAAGTAGAAGVGMTGTAVGVGLTGTAAAGSAATGIFSGMSLAQGMSAAGTLIQGFSQYKQGQAMAAGYEANAEAAEYNMHQEEAKSAEKFDQIVGQQRTLYGAAGVDITSGSPLLIYTDTEFKRKKEEGRIKYAGELESAFSKYYAKQSKKAGVNEMLTTFITGLGSNMLLNKN